VTTALSDSNAPAKPSAIRAAIVSLGAAATNVVSYVGSVSWLVAQTLVWLWRGLVLRQVRLGRPALYAQMMRVGVRSLGVIALVSGCIGMILALQMAPPLDQFGQTDKVANIIGVAVLRELGPLISAIVLTGFAGASIAAELGTMVVGEEVEALRAHALNPFRFLVLPRLLATILCLIVLAIIGSLVALAAGMGMGVFLLEIPPRIYYDNTLTQLKVSDFLTGLVKAGVFGGIIGAIACHNGLAVSGGAAGVGKATTNTVVFSIVTIIFSDLLFTAVFYRLGWT
jgi:phospholipid/cholesterol/gamma-HCH transport system permease protein